MIRWPEKYSPDRTKVHVHNELDMPVPAEAVWAWLIRADLWPTWYSNSQNVAIEGGAKELKLGTVFHWKTFSVTLTSKVEEFVPPERLGWSAHAGGIDAYHAWIIDKRPSGCRVLTEENQNGLLARLSGTLRPQHMVRFHQLWLEALLGKAKSGPPPP